MKEISAKELQNLLEENKEVNMIDVREVDEVAEGKIPGVVNIPLGLVEARMHELDQAKEYIMVCRSGGRSGRATEFLESHGFNCINMTGGMLAWEGETE
ncbi:rhodanese-like domain-containing protein [Bacillaceae bacterium SIJ1]|uniref:rhodanese-like domain-containing protein n=1 Tax=Litoribacterium kuwaitense TaxID=1398745 RepID=UPI0013ECE50C|nr:rhodanese-like domain-containing protein [Litoribacterium kuwaitense]NGP43789.1 rhodanese-like domain-containing protein [Litoribacterium kuwaitense]